MKGRPFKSVSALHPARSVFNLSYSKLFTCKEAQLIPVLHDLALPGDKWYIGNEIVVRLQPLMAPVLHEVNVFVHYFFVPSRLLWEDFPDFIDGGVDGDDASVMPVWQPGAGEYDLGTLWDYFGFPLNTCAGVEPSDLIRRCYYKIWNDYYRDNNLQLELDITDQNNYQIMQRSWAKDYFTSCQLEQQRGTAPALPISGTINTSAVWTSDFAEGLTFNNEGSPVVGNRAAGLSPIEVFNANTSQVVAGFFTTTIEDGNLNNNTVAVNLAGATTFNVSDIRLAVQIQRFMELTQQGGVRYPEFLHTFWGVPILDARLQRAEYLGGSRNGIIFSEVLQTSQSDTTPQGTMKGHGISAGQNFCAKYYVPEYGIIMGIMSIMPVPMYQQGVNRQWLYKNRYEFPNPVFMNLSEQEVLTGELYATNTQADNLTVFGFQGRFDEHRYKPSFVAGLMRSGVAGSLDIWHQARYFTDVPTLTEDFIECIPDPRIFADEVDDGFIVHFGNVIKCIRPLPALARPGLLDHV